MDALALLDVTSRLRDDTQTLLLDARRSILTDVERQARADALRHRLEALDGPLVALGDATAAGHLRAAVARLDEAVTATASGDYDTADVKLGSATADLTYGLPSGEPSLVDRFIAARDAGASADELWDIRDQAKRIDPGSPQLKRIHELLREMRQYAPPRRRT